MNDALRETVDQRAVAPAHPEHLAEPRCNLCLDTAVAVATAPRYCQHEIAVRRSDTLAANQQRLRCLQEHVFEKKCFSTIATSVGLMMLKCGNGNEFA